MSIQHQILDSDSCIMRSPPGDSPSPLARDRHTAMSARPRVTVSDILSTGGAARPVRDGLAACCGHSYNGRWHRDTSLVEDSGMNRALAQRQAQTLCDDPQTYRKLELNYRRNKTQDNTASIDSLAAAFRYEDCQHMYWNPERFSLLYGTPLWEQATATQRIILNQLYWVAYYAQIISAEIATIFFNQTSAAGLYALEDFRLVCD